MQSRGNGVERGRQSQFPESTRTLKGQDLFLGSLLFLTKTAPSPRFRANMFLQYDVRSGRLTPSDDIRYRVNYLDDKLRGKAVDNSDAIIDSEQEVIVDKF